MLKFTDIKRRNPEKRDVLKRLKDFDEVYELLSDNETSRQASRCIGCGDPYCHNKCPLHNFIPNWLKQIASNDLELAFKLSNESSPFPEILGKICPHDVLCEGDCTLNDTHGAVTIGAVETYLNEKAFENGYKPTFPKITSKKKVAIIGSGPAGLSTATFLLRKGIGVEVFERAAKGGGLLTFGIPGFKLDKNKVQRRIDWLLGAGMKLHLNCEIGKDKSFEDLTKEFDAVFIGIGATKGKTAGIDGENASNIHLAMEFLTAIQKRNFGLNIENFIDVKDKNVVVIGGGDTAMDCVRTSVREGAKSVKCLYRRDENTMPGSKKEVVNAKEEGVEFVFNVSPTKIILENGFATGVELVKTELDFSTSKRGTLQNIAGSEYIENADIIIYALGFDQEVPSFIKESGIELDKWNGIKTNENYQSSNPKIFAGGDVVRGADLAVTATADGRNAAFKIIEFLK
ncbi:glutamate synthase subunit beta [Arcobacter sp. FWKO B]|uniref:glutamate synthase subunit beta n=1 Tax=Arcobacter sp. FWKO B TaxID=2593672 RepID=UPI0018A43B9D|nr:glutamate synthase subunit beta [Arcobacter sp. FWKO B]QOG11517.1 glutamate synthase subunit beta [Arcobacter sp. FWKO B]